MSRQSTITLQPAIPIITVPTEITVHLGAPDEDAENVTVPYIDYIKNVASSELYPTWPENAIRANIYAISSIAMNRIFTEWYRTRGYNFDITNSTQYDQAYVYNRDIYDNIARITDELYNQYIVKEGQIQPLFAQFCDGRVSQCNGLYQWGTVDLAQQGYSPLEILKYYYGEDINIVTGAPTGTIQETYPGEPLKLGDSGLDVFRMQFNLDRIRANYPAIPPIPVIDGYFNEATEAAVKTFQSVFNLPVTGIIDKATWNSIRRIYAAVTKLAELRTEGLLISRIGEYSAEVLFEGDVRPGVEILQFGLNVLAAFNEAIPEIAITGIFDEQTKNAVIAFQKSVGLPQTGVVNKETMDAIYGAVVDTLKTLPPEAVYLPHIRWPGIIYSLGYQSAGVYVIQEMLSYISLIVPTIPFIEPTGTYDEATQNAVIAFQNMVGLEHTGIVDEVTWNRIVEVYRQQRFGGIAPRQILNIEQ